MDRVGRPDTDSEPQAPFKIMGNVYYVGANNIASILVATPQGHILLDTGTQKMAAVVFPNIVKLGFKPADIKVMLISHAHYDHMETMETIRRITGATVAALEAEVPPWSVATTFRPTRRGARSRSRSAVSSRPGKTSIWEGQRSR